MEFTKLGRTGLNVSVAGLGAGGNSRIGRRQNLTDDETVALIRYGFSLGINFIDTARAYGTEEIVGRALNEEGRDKIVVSTKSGISTAGRLINAESLGLNIEQSLQQLKTDYIDVFHLHAVEPDQYGYARSELIPVLTKHQEQGKIRFIGITEASTSDFHQVTMRQAVDDDLWDVIMIAFNMMHQGPRRTVFPTTQTNDIGTLAMFVVRSIFSQPERLTTAVRDLVVRGELPPWLAQANKPLEFLIHDAGASSIMDAAYRYARHEPGVDVVLFGTGSREHLKQNVASLLRPPLPASDLAKIEALFGELAGTGLDTTGR